MTDFAVTPFSAPVAESPPPPAKSTVEAATPLPQPVVAVPNPELLLDIQVGIAVIEFRSEDGAVTLSIPSQKQLDAYASGAYPSEAGSAGSDAPLSIV